MTEQEINTSLPLWENYLRDAVHAAADQPHRTTWITSGGERIAAIVPAEAAAHWEAAKAQEATAAAYGAQFRISHHDVSAEREGYAPDEIVLPAPQQGRWRGSPAGGISFRTRRGTVLTEAEVDRLAEEAEAGYDLKPGQLHKTVNHPAVITRLAAVTAALIRKGILTPSEIGLPNSLTIRYGTWDKRIERWLRDDG